MESWELQGSDDLDELYERAGFRHAVRRVNNKTEFSSAMNCEQLQPSRLYIHIQRCQTRNAVFDGSIALFIFPICTSVKVTLLEFK